MDSSIHSDFQGIIDDRILPFLKGKNVIYLDYPIHFNIGDLAIYHGVETFFLVHEIRVIERFNIHNISYKRIHNLCKKYGEIVFLWHGGGNMWDLYFKKAELKRRSFIQAFWNYRIVFLPQSIYYQEEANLISSIECYNRPNIVIATRDARSYELAIQRYPLAVCLLCPDMAFYLEKTHYIERFRSILSSRKHLVIYRNDKEKMTTKIYQTKTWLDITDWLLMTGFFIKIAGYFIAWYLKALSFFWYNSTLLTWFWFLISRKLLSKWFLKIAQYSIIETDRLHGYILGYLLHKKCITHDNLYGKIGNYRKTWNI